MGTDERDTKVRTELGSRAVHVGRESEMNGFRGTSVAIEASSAFVHPDVPTSYRVFEGDEGYVYSRIANPTVNALEAALADLESGEQAIAFGSGMAAIHAAWLACEPGPKRPIVVLKDVYGSTLTLARRLAQLGTPCVETTADEVGNTLSMLVEQGLSPALIHVEAIANPLTTVHHIPTLAKLARTCGARLVVDATFATPILLRPLEQGADLAVQSLTKYLGGHGDLTGGSVAGRDLELMGLVKQALVEAGAAMSPFDAWLTLRGIRTLPLRMERHCANAQRVAEALGEMKRVVNVHYPGLSTHPQHSLASELLDGGYGGMLAFEIVGGSQEALALLQQLEMIQPATTLGDVASLALCPALSSHRDLHPAELDAIGIPAGLIRLSVGIEAASDIVADLRQALSVS